MRTGASGPLQFNPLDLAQEAWKFQQHLAEGMRTLGQLPPDVHYGATEREEVWRDGKTVLYRFVGDKPATAKVPLLVSYALVNRPYMVDLQADRSLVKGLLERGEDVYIIDWGYPDRSDRFLTLEDYIERYIGGAVDHLRRTHAVPAVNLLAVNIGWLISGTVVIESLFAIPGIGQLLVRGIFTRDYMVVQGVAMVLACATVVVNFLADLVTVALDPRVKMQ